MLSSLPILIPTSSFQIDTDYSLFLPSSSGSDSSHSRPLLTALNGRIRGAVIIFLLATFQQAESIDLDLDALGFQILPSSGQSTAYIIGSYHPSSNREHSVTRRRGVRHATDSQLPTTLVLHSFSPTVPLDLQLFHSFSGGQSCPHLIPAYLCGKRHNAICSSFNQLRVVLLFRPTSHLPPFGHIGPTLLKHLHRRITSSPLEYPTLCRYTLWPLRPSSPLWKPSTNPLRLWKMSPRWN